MFKAPPAAARAGILALACAVWLPAAAPADTPAAAETVDRLHAALVDVMKNADALRYEGRREKLAPVIVESFDLGYICRIILGRQWDGMSEDEHARMVDTFTRLTVATYAARFDGYSGESFRNVEVSEMNRGRMMVRTELVRPSDDPVHLDYVLQEREGRWRIVNVVAEGVSDLSLKRADYGSVIKREGFDALIEKLEGQIAGLESGA